MAPQLTLYAIGTGPNPIKIALALTALNLEYNVESLSFGDGENGVKNSKFLKINPNGRAPALVDHSNNDFTVWESAAILYYLGEKYDPQGKLLGKTIEEKTLVQQWLYFQASGHGPVQGNLHFLNFGMYKRIHGEEAPASFVSRFDSEAKRVYGVFDQQLAQQNARGSPWLVLDHVTAADFALFVWVKMIARAKLDLAAFPNVQKWFELLGKADDTRKAYASIPNSE